MRVIDADALIDDLEHDVVMDQDSLDHEELTDANREIIQFDKDYKQNAIELLKHAPTIEPERERGKWMLKEHKWECNQCGCRIRRAKPFSGNIWNYYFCPNCGADMREEQNE